MEYAIYILIILGIMGLIHYLMRDPERSLVSTEKAPRARNEKSPAKKHSEKGKSSFEQLSALRSLNREAVNVPTPWGWPGHVQQTTGTRHTISGTEDSHHVSETLQLFVDHLISEKQTVESMDYVLKKDASLRALIEDRYSRTITKKDNNRNKRHRIHNPGRKPARQTLLEVKTPWGW